MPKLLMEDYDLTVCKNTLIIKYNNIHLITYLPSFTGFIANPNTHIFSLSGPYTIKYETDKTLVVQSLDGQSYKQEFTLDKQDLIDSIEFHKLLG